MTPYVVDPYDGWELMMEMTLIAKIEKNDNKSVKATLAVSTLEILSLTT